jgi:hypothetical protein
MASHGQARSGCGWPRLTEVWLWRAVAGAWPGCGWSATFPSSSTWHICCHHGDGARGVGWCLLRRRGGASGCDGPLPVVVLWRRRGTGYYHDHKRALGVVLSDESLHRLTVGMMAAPLGRRSPRWEHHGEAMCSRHVGLLG